jgi:hypothetical protein
LCVARTVSKGALLCVGRRWFNMYRHEDREAEMVRNAEHLHSLAVMEAVLDEELDRLESEYHWDCRKYTYLQAIECDPAHLRHLTLSMQRSRSLSDVLRSLLDFTFEEKIIFMNTVEKQQEHWRKEDDHQYYHHFNDHQHHHDDIDQHQKKPQYSFSTNSSLKILKTMNHKHIYLRNKRNKQFMPSLRNLKTQTLGSRMFSLTSKVKFGKRNKLTSRLIHVGIPKLSRASHRFARARHVLKKHRQMKH